VFLVRHGETEWTITGKLTGRADVPLTARGVSEAERAGEELRGLPFTRVFTSPQSRARQTCERAGFGDRAELDPDLLEWDYGSYQGMRTEDVRRERPGWSLFRDGCPGGESPEAIGERADRVVARLREEGGRVLLFSHGHFLRALGARWIGQPVLIGRHLYLSTAALSVLGYEHTLESAVLRLWNRNSLPPT
jgi:probable phosphoglycerate mutase